MEKTNSDRRSIDLVVFDLGGTTVEDRGDVAGAFRETLRHHRIDVGDVELETYRGRSKREVFRSLLNQNNADEGLTRTDEVYRLFCEEVKQRFIRNGIGQIPQADQVFSWLREQRIRVAITTGFDRTIADLILEKTSWDDGLVDASVCADEVSRGRPAPYMIFRAMEMTGVIDVGRVVKVGDTTADIEAGIHAGVRVKVGVMSGAHKRERLIAAGASHVIPSVADLPELFKNEHL